MEAMTASDQIAMPAATRRGVVSTITGSGPSGSRRSCHPKKGRANNCNSVVAPNMAVRVWVVRSERLLNRKSKLISSANSSTWPTDMNRPRINPALGTALMALVITASAAVANSRVSERGTSWARCRKRHRLMNSCRKLTIRFNQ
ncbi:MAG: hypothetical protein CL386_08120 [Acidiferrobacter sp.]|nr:hypothetical protein [Acidiferrobacter sp.]